MLLESFLLRQFLRKRRVIRFERSAGLCFSHEWGIFLLAARVGFELMWDIVGRITFLAG